MAPVANSADQTAELLQQFSLETKPKPLEIPEPNKKATGNQFGAVDSGNALNGQIPSYERTVTSVVPDYMDPAMCYLPSGYPSTAYYYSGYDGTGSEWEDFSRYLNPDGVDLTSAVYGENGSLVYHPGYGYAPYTPYSPAGSPVPTVGNDGQFYAPQHYQYPPYFQPLAQTSGPFTTTPGVHPQGEISTSGTGDQKPLSVEAANGNSNPGTNGTSAKGRSHTSGHQDPKFGFDGARTPNPWLDAPIFSDGQPRPVSNKSISSSISSGNNGPASRNQTYRPNSHYMGLHHPTPIPAMGGTPGFINRMYPNKVYGQYGNAVRSSMAYGTQYDSRTNGRAWLAVDNKYKTRGRNGYFGYGSENTDGLNELNRGPRAKGGKNQKVFAPTVLAVKGQNLPVNSVDEEKEKTSTNPDREQYNKADFPEEYANAKFFVIKSYSEDDIHKSIKYNVWASTQNGNKKLDAAYQEAQQKTGSCPIFLLFSVNTSGQFVGLAEMIGPVDFNKSLEYWQQDKWNGCFPLKWHIVKDVPNNALRHITLENNENKPVTNSRDTQEVMLEPGLKLIKIFKEYSSKTSILDDFGFYEGRQKTILEKKAKQQYPKQVWEGKPTDEKIDVNGEVSTQKSEVTSELLKEATLSEKDNDGDKGSGSGAVAQTGEAPKGAIPVISESKIVPNGVANGC